MVININFCQTSVCLFINCYICEEYTRNCHKMAEVTDAAKKSDGLNSLKGNFICGVVEGIRKNISFIN